MSVIPLTIFFSLLLAGTFVLLFAREQHRRFSSAERDSLLPLAEEGQVVERDLRARFERVQPVRHSLGDGGRSRSTSNHDHADACGCRRGVRAPCDGCLRRRDAQDPVYF